MILPPIIVVVGMRLRSLKSIVSGLETYSFAQGLLCPNKSFENCFKYCKGTINVDTVSICSFPDNHCGNFSFSPRQRCSCEVVSKIRGANVESAAAA
jgi:hypothetical protein